nr:hypothetical protein [Cytophagales bacterium]
MKQHVKILGISAFYHDSAAALVIDGEVIAAAEEERFTRIKHDASFPINAIRFVLEEGGIASDELDRVVFYEKPFLKFERLLETYHAFAPKGLLSFVKSVPIWTKEKLFMKRRMVRELRAMGQTTVPLFFTSHHLSHAASAYYPSPFSEAAIVTIDGVGEWGTVTISHAKTNRISILREQHFPHSIGLFYSAITYYAGFRVNSGEYKVMGLAPYASADSPSVKVMVEKLKLNVIDIKDDGSILLNMKFFKFATGLTMTHDRRWEGLFGFPRRAFDSNLEETHINMARAGQEILEEVVLKLATTAKKMTGADYLCLAGGVALNCVANAKIRAAHLFSDIWVQPAAGDAGGALGAAYAGYHILGNEPKTSVTDAMKGAFLGPEYSVKDISNTLRKYSIEYEFYNDFDRLCQIVARFIQEGLVVGWFQGKMEFGPRALGNRSIIADPSYPEMQKRLNVKIKNRETFRPFAPAVLEEDAPDFFDIDVSSPYMLFTCLLKAGLRYEMPTDYGSFSLAQRLTQERSKLQAITHVDFSARVQTVSEQTNPKFHRLLREVKALTGRGILINTSMNVRGEPMVCSPEDATRCFLQTDMDVLVLGDFLITKNESNRRLIASEKTAKFAPD